MFCGCPVCTARRAAERNARAIYEARAAYRGKRPHTVVVDDIYLTNDSYLGKHTAMSTIRPANTHNEIILLVQAAASGKKLQASRRADKVEAWGDMTNPNFNFMDFRYRVKPEPLVIFVVYTRLGSVYEVTRDEAHAQRLVKAGGSIGRTYKKFVEVI